MEAGNRSKDSQSAVGAFSSFQTRLNFLETLLKDQKLRRHEDLKIWSEDLINQLKDLRLNLSSPECLTFGGKFEWVDSILVKSLKDGSWLLMEDVNLCSNAVLDRLNGLLEPNGCLIIGERGAKPNGEMVSIKPHPNFRLFFTMEPVNGTISRAMRNRGVEIYLLSEESVNEWPMLDLISLLSNVGIRNPDIQSALIQVESAAERHNISNFISNGFRMAQYIKNGFSVSESFLYSTKQIYKFTDSCKENLVEELAKNLSEDKHFNVSLARPSIENYLVDPTYARLKKSCALLQITVDAMKRCGVDDILPTNVFEFCFKYSPSFKNVKALDFMKFNILHIYLTASEDNFVYLNPFISKILTEMGDVKLKSFADKIEEKWKLIKTEPGISNSFPWDRRWFKNVEKLLNNKSSEDSNKFLVLMKFFFHYIDMEDSVVTKDITVEKYSKAVEEGRSEDSFSNQPIVSKFSTYLRDFDNLIIDTLSNKSIQINESYAEWFLNEMKWRFRFGSLGKLTLLSDGNKKTLNEDALTLLELHLSWFLKFVIFKDKHSLNALPQSLERRYSQFLKISKDLVSTQTSSKLVKMSNLFRRQLGHPPPNKYALLEESRVEEVTYMDVCDIQPHFDFLSHADFVILQSILNTFLVYLHRNLISISKEVEEQNNSNFEKLFFDKFLILLTKVQSRVQETRPLSALFREFFSSSFKGKQKLISEITHECLKLLNLNYEFEDTMKENFEDSRIFQILPYHRSVWTCRVLKVVFGYENMWTLSTAEKSHLELSNLLITIIPNIPFYYDEKEQTSIINILSNEKENLKFRLDKIIKNIKLSLSGNYESEGLEEILKDISAKSIFGIEKIFYKRLESIVRTLSKVKLHLDSGFKAVGCHWLLLGLLELLVLREGKVDPIRKKLIKANYIKNEISSLESELLALEFFSIITGISEDHFYFMNLRSQIDEMRKNQLKYNNLDAVKRNSEKFRTICKEVESFMTNFDEILRFFENFWDKVFLGEDISFARHLYTKGRFIVLRIKTLSEGLAKFKSEFGDLIYPILSAFSQIEHGMNLIMCELHRLPYCKGKEVESYLEDLFRFPIISSKKCSLQLQNLNKTEWPVEALKTIEQNKLLVLFSSCMAKYNEWLFFKSESTFMELMTVFSKVVEFWKIEEERKKILELEKESLYIKKSAEKCTTEPDEEELMKEQLKLFPTFEEDFSENTSKIETSDHPKEVGISLHSNHLFQVCTLHMKMVKEFVKVDWTTARTSSLFPDLVSPICMRFALLFNLLPNISFLMNRDTDLKLLPGLLVVIKAKQMGKCTSDAQLSVEWGKIYDFYQDPNKEEVMKCLTVLKELKERLQTLLNEWPDHPTLLQIEVVIERILGFSINSPVMKFLTGIEILLQSCQHWESVAHSGVSIRNHLVSITNLIIEWRKLELQGWRLCLQAAHERIKKETFKWWFHFWCLVEEYLDKEDSPNSESKSSLEDLIKTLYNFIETSPAGEFESRLEIILSYHYHLLHAPQSDKRDVLSICLWNLYVFYQQFSVDVAKKLSDDSAPIFKKLKEFVSIAKWHDITYWSVKQAIEKSHRTLLKFIKEYEVLLKRRVELNFFDPTKKEVSRKTRENFEVDITKFLKTCTEAEKIADVPEGVFLVKNFKKKLEKAKKFSNDIILTAEYPKLVLSLEELTGNICESVEHFASLDVNRNLPLEKQKSQAKNIVHQKRRALADLFKTLQKIGLSYRAGLKGSAFDILEFVKGPPINYMNSESVSKKGTPGESYFLKTIFRRVVLENSLLTPSKEIGSQVIERLRGYSRHIMELNFKQKVTLNEATVGLDKLKSFDVILDFFVRGNGFIPNQKRFFHEVLNFHNVICETCYVCQQFSVVLESWPSSGGEAMREMNFLASNYAPVVFMSSQNDNLYDKAKKSFQNILKSFNEIQETFEKKLIHETSFFVRSVGGDSKIYKKDFQFYTSDHVNMFDKSVVEYKKVMQDLEDFLKNLEDKFVSCPLTDCFNHLKQLKKTCECYIPMDNILEEKKNKLLHILQTNVDTLIENILLGIQRLVKKYKEKVKKSDSGVDAECTNEALVEEDNSTELLNNHLNEELVESLYSDLLLLNMDGVNGIILSIFSHLNSISELGDVMVNSEYFFRVLSTAQLFLKQYLTLCSYFVSQQNLCFRSSNKLSSVITGAFIQVARKGYCAPPEYEDDGEGEEGWNNDGNGGFTGDDAGGQKDVSDKIESEDQLEGAYPEGQEKENQDDKNCKEEKNGIEMSENFEGKTQNLDDEEEADEEEREEDEVSDVEMGETDQGTDKLETELWSDSENEEETNERKSQEKGQGKEINKDNYGAKEDDDNDDDQVHGTEAEKNKKEKKKEINEMEEPEDNGDQVDPYHGNLPPEVEPEPLDLPDNMQLDDGDVKGDENEGEENPFDIDTMKEYQPSKEVDSEESNKNKENNIDNEVNNSNDEECSDEENLQKEDKMDVDEEECDDVESEDEEGMQGKKGEDNKEHENEIDKEDKEMILDTEYHPSDDKASSAPAQPAPETDKSETTSSDQVTGSDEKKSNEFQPQEVSQQLDMDQKGVGQSEIQQSMKGHDANSSKKEKIQPGESQIEKERKRERPGKSDEDRCLGDPESSVNKKMRTLEKVNENKEEESDGVENDESNLYRHVSEKIQEATQVLDAATKEQAESQATLNKEDNNVESNNDDDVVAMDVDEEDRQVDEIEQLSSQIKGEKNSNKNKESAEGDLRTEDVKHEVEGDIIGTMKAERAPETTFHTKLSALGDERSYPLQPEKIQALRTEIQQQLSQCHLKMATGSENVQTWQLLTSVVDNLARDLSEQLRIILEPTQATRLKGDYRTGRRINMRKVIGYIASEFRKDSIWLRRTKPWKREHDIVVAIDDSSSMSHNESKELAFESLALISKALGFVEAGQLGVLRFGENTKIVHRLGDPFTDDTGPRILQEFTFEQKKTLVCEMLDISTEMMISEKKREDVARLLLIISDGRGVFSEGLERVKASVRRATDLGIFLVFVIIDNPKSKDSIMDIRMPEFKDGKFIGINSYMELFPFPFYVVLRDIAALPSTLGDALRQWFQLISFDNYNR